MYLNISIETNSKTCGPKVKSISSKHIAGSMFNDMHHTKNHIRLPHTTRCVAPGNDDDPLDQHRVYIRSVFRATTVARATPPQPSKDARYVNATCVQVFVFDCLPPQLSLYMLYYALLVSV